MEAKQTHWMKLGIAALALVITATAGADRGHRHSHERYTQRNACTMIPPNTLLFSTEAKTGIDEKMFNLIIDKAEEIYGPIIQAKGGKLNIERNWDDDTVNAYADRSGNVWNVAMFGGLARHPETTPDAFAEVVCHELGHHLGGKPKYSYLDWASAEGQADYFATLKCMRTILAKVDNWQTIERWYPADEVPQVVKDRCKMGHPDQNEFAICVRGAMGGKALARLLASLGNDKMPEFETPDQSKVKKTQESHPHAQCRLDTYFQGAVCHVSHTQDVSDTDPKTGTCHEATPAPGAGRFSRNETNLFGIRPYCWYAP